MYGLLKKYQLPINVNIVTRDKDDEIVGLTEQWIFG